MKKLVMAFVLATVLAAILRASAGQRGAGTGSRQPEAGSRNGSHRRRVPSPGADVAETIGEAIEVSASDLSSAPAGDGGAAVEGAHNN